MEFQSSEIRYAEVKLVFGLFSCMVLNYSSPMTALLFINGSCY